MGQYEVLEFLKKIYPNKITANEISKELKYTYYSVLRALQKLIKDNFVKREQLDITGKYIKIQYLYYYNNIGDI